MAGAACTGRRHGTRSALDVEQALVDELVDAERAELASEAGALHPTEGNVGPLTGRSVDVGHADLELLGWPLRLFGEKYRFDRPTGGRDETSFWGLELELDWPAQPYLRVPAGSLRAGALEVLEGPLEDEIEVYFSVAWRP